MTDGFLLQTGGKMSTPHETDFALLQEFTNLIHHLISGSFMSATRVELSRWSNIGSSWRCLLLLQLVCSLVLVAGCNKEENTKGAGKTTASKPKKIIGVSLLTLENPHFKVIGDHIESAGTKHDYDVIVVSADHDVAKQRNQVKDFIVQGVSAIVLSPCDRKSIVPVIQEANKAGIPVFTVDIPCNEPGVKIVTQIASDNYGGGKIAAMAMIEALGEAGGPIAVLHFKQAESCQLRVNGFKEVIDAHNETGKAKVNIVAELEGGGAKDKGYKATEDALQANPKLRGIFAINDPSALGARAAIEKAGKSEQILIVGFDGQPEGKQAIKDGKIFADPIQFPDKMGDQIVDAIIRHSKGDDVPPEMLIPTSLYRKADAEKDPELK
jgi:ribose transport system substrate-binding protein